MSKLSVPEAASLLNVSPARVRQRIADGSLVAEKVGGRWLVDLSISLSGSRRGRPANSDLVWEAIRLAEEARSIGSASEHEFSKELIRAFSDKYPLPHFAGERPGPDLILSDGSHVGVRSSASSRRRALHRLLAAHDEAQSTADPGPSCSALLDWMSRRAERRIYRVSQPDFQPLHDDPRLVRSGVSHPDSGLEDPRVVEGYVAYGQLGALIQDHWLDPVGVDQKPNVILHVAPGRPSDVSRLMLAADLAEHGGPRELRRAHELVAEALT